MSRADKAQDRRMQKFRDVLSSWEAGRYSLLEAAALLGCSERQFRRYRDRFEEAGEDGLKDRRLGKPSQRAIAAVDRDAIGSPHDPRARASPVGGRPRHPVPALSASGKSGQTERVTSCSREVRLAKGH